jgi:pimeloyl-ACP methyl ester carboxylesterase
MPERNGAGWLLACALILLGGVGCVQLLGCAADGRARALENAQAQGLRRLAFQGKTFTLAGWLKCGDSPTLVAYIEGDGAAFVNRRTPSADPTPRDPLAFKLALADPAPSVLYLARPCQYASDAERRNCAAPYWTSARYAEPVIADLDAALSQAKDLCRAGKLELVGYSGGGAAAALVAARRQDVGRLITVAANLDLGAWTRLHDVSPLHDSLDPLLVAETLRELPQIHFAGEDDAVVPASVIQPFVDRVGNPKRARLVLVPDQSHHCCWSVIWPRLLQEARLAESSGFPK